jgi:hypothetical protein
MNRRVVVFMGGLLAGLGLALGARAVLLDYANVVVFGGLVLGLGFGLILVGTLRD